LPALDGAARRDLAPLVTRGTKAAPVEGEHLLYTFLTTVANAEVAPVHPKAMPVLMRTAEEIDRWLAAPLENTARTPTPVAGRGSPDRRHRPEAGRLCFSAGRPGFLVGRPV
jgi:hypothetical protein